MCPDLRSVIGFSDTLTNIDYWTWRLPALEIQRPGNMVASINSFL